MRAFFVLAGLALVGSCSEVCACVYPSARARIYGELPGAGTADQWDRAEVRIGAPPCDDFAIKRQRELEISPSGTFNQLLWVPGADADWCVQVKYFQTLEPSSASVQLAPKLVTFYLEGPGNDSTHFPQPTLP